MSIRIVRRSDLSTEEVGSLDRAMAEFYARTPASYYEIAGRAAEQYSAAQQPFHLHLVDQVRPGMEVLEMGCGTAHLCPHVEARGGRYTGLDYGVELLASNRARHPNARFLQIGTALEEQFDLVASLYTIEHVADPPAYLSKMWAATKAGGLLAIICPEFIECEGCPPSVFYGTSPRRLRDKLKAFAFTDAILHATDVQWTAPRWKQEARHAPAGAFWINTAPAVLHGAPYSIDADAVHLPRLRDLEWWLKEQGAEIVATSQTLPDVSAEVLRFNCYILARKPAASTGAALASPGTSS